MDREWKRAAFDAEKETDLYAGGSGGQNQKRALRQMVVVLIVLLSLSFAAFFAITWLGRQQSQGLTDSTLVKYEGMTFAYVESSSEITALGLTAPFSETDCGDYLTMLNIPSEEKSCAAYRLNAISSKALLLVNRQDAYFLYRFCYFSEADTHTGQDILDVCGSETVLMSIACYGTKRGDSYEEWEKTISNTTELGTFEELFGELTPMDAGDSLKEEINQSGSWDAIATLKYKNGLTFNLCIYNKLKVATGFRCVYTIPDELIGLLGQYS